MVKKYVLYLLCLFGCALDIAAASYTAAAMLIVSNAVASWPTAPASPGAAALVNSNGVVYLLTSGTGNTWTSTNKLAP